MWACSRIPSLARSSSTATATPAPASWAASTSAPPTSPSTRWAAAATGSTRSCAPRARAAAAPPGSGYNPNSELLARGTWTKHWQYSPRDTWHSEEVDRVKLKTFPDVKAETSSHNVKWKSFFFCEYLISVIYHLKMCSKQFFQKFFFYFRTL